MRDRLNAPLIFDRNLGGYRFETTAASGSARSMNCPACGSPPRKSMPC
jgi:hypothetical protein